MEYGQVSTTLAVNVGGALIPTGVSLYLLSQSPLTTMFLCLIGIFAVAVITHIIAKPVKVLESPLQPLFHL